MKKALLAGVLAGSLTLAGPFALTLAAAGATPTPTGSNVSCQVSGAGAALLASAAQAAGFPAEQLTTAVAIGLAESGGNPTATHLNDNGTTDYGLWQIDSVHTAILASGDWRDPASNARMALAVWQASGGSWTPWATFTSGAYTGHLAAAATAVTGTPAPTCTATAVAGQSSVVDVARQFLGVPYLWAGNTPAGFDCSGLSSYAYSHGPGITIPRTAADQYAASTKVPAGQEQPGDLAFWDTPVGHVGIVIGGGQMIDAQHTGTVILTEPLWPNPVGFGRFP